MEICNENSQKWLSVKNNKQEVISELIMAEESETLERKSSFWYDYNKAKYMENYNPNMFKHEREFDVIKAVAGLMNKDGVY